MRHHARLLLAVPVCAVALAACVGTASARRFALNAQAFRIAWRSLRFFAGEGLPSGACPVTMEGSFHSRTISKVCGGLVGYISRAIVGPQTEPPCTFANGAESVRILTAGLPWHLRYDSFTGTLPTINTIKWELIGAGVLITGLGQSCLYKSTTANPLDFYFFIHGTEGRGTTIPLFEGNPLFCPASGGVEGIDAVTILESTTALTVNLVQ